MKRFNKVNIEISNVCNLQCSFCPEVIRSKKLMSLDLFQKIIKEVSPLTEQVCFHLMGDPLVHPQIDQMIKICENEKVKIFFVTNGLLMREKQIDLLLSPALRQVNFSIHSFKDNFPGRDPTDYLNRIFNYTERALREREDLYINFRLWNLQDAISSSTENEQMLDRICEHFQTPVPTGVNVKRNKSIRLRGRLYLHFDTEFVWPSMTLPVLGSRGTCYGLSSHFGILVDGTVVPCCLDKEGDIPLGNVNEKPLLEILDSERSQKILRGFKNKKLEESLCQRCQYIERFSSSSEREKSTFQ